MSFNLFRKASAASYITSQMCSRELIWIAFDTFRKDIGIIIKCRIEDAVEGQKRLIVEYNNLRTWEDFPIQYLEMSLDDFSRFVLNKIALRLFT